MQPRNFVLVSVAALSIGGCANTTSGGIGGPDPVQQIISITQSTCGFLPTAETVANIVSTGQFSAYFSIANAICAAVTAIPPRSAAPGAVRKVPAPVVAGVPVHGKFVGK